MAMMILSHPRARSTLMGNCFKEYWGEIFNINIVDKNTFEIPTVPVVDPMLNFLLWQEEWADRYLKYLEEKIKKSPNVCFKLFYDQIFHCARALDLIDRINPEVIFIRRANELEAIKSLLVAKKRGYSHNLQIECSPFMVTQQSFYYAYRVCVILPKLAKEKYQPVWCTTYEEFNIQTFPYREKMPPANFKNQNSNDSFSLILNEAEVEKWYSLLKL
jgi:hypothetical protein